jgi:hypothetical protein
MDSDRASAAGGRIAIGLAIVGGVLALINVIIGYQRTGELDYGRLALAIGVPCFFYAIFKSKTGKPPR